jgi:PAS domain S-box-containing protein
MSGDLPHVSPNPDATGAAEPLPPQAGALTREAHERQAAFQRGQQKAAEPDYTLCAPEVAGLDANLLYTLVAENVRDYAIFLMDPDGIIRCWGEGARLMKWWTRQQAEGAHLRLLYPDGGSEDGTAEHHIQAAAERGEYNGEGHRVRSDGTLFWAYVTLTALRNPDGKLVGFTKVTRDFTARRAVEAALRERADHPPDAALLEKLERQQRLMASVSHELRAPLNAILGYATLLQGQVGGRERQQAHLDRLTRSGHHLLEIINDVLDIGRAEAGVLPVAASRNRIGPTVDEALADAAAQADAQGITISNAVSGGPGDLPYWGDASRVRQIIVNLLVNAIKFTDRGGHVTLSAGTGEHVTGADLAGPGPWVYVRIEDTGRGIPGDRLSAMFEPYQQSDAADQHRGSGLGLSISRQFARAMGGDLTATSEPGEGSTFTLWLPMAPSEPVPR